jgi:hypothetical protein
MLNNNTLQVLAQLGAINNSMIITYPVTTVIMGKNIQAFLNLEKLGETEFDEIGVYNISEFNSVINVIDNPTIENESGVLTISNDKSSIKYGTTSIDIIESECRGNPELIDKIKTNENVMSFTIGVKDLDKIKKMSGLLKDLSELNLSGSNEGKDKVTLKVTSKEKSSNNYSIILDGEVNENVDMTLIMDVVNKLPASEFKVTIYKSKKGSLVSVWDSVNVEGLSIIISAKAS